MLARSGIIRSIAILFVFATGCTQGTLTFTSVEEKALRQSQLEDKAAFGYSCRPGQAPAPNRLARLSKQEYVNSIQDLLLYQFTADSNSTSDRVRREGLAQTAFNTFSPELDSIKNPPSQLRYSRADNTMDTSEALAYASVAGKLGILIANSVNGSTSSLTDLRDFFGACASNLSSQVTRASSSAPWTLLDTNGSQTACLNSFLEKFGFLAYHRPLTADERAAMIRIYANSLGQTGLVSGNSAASGSPRIGLALMIMRLLSAPQFVYHFQLPHDNPEATGSYEFELDAYQLASKLSYQFWESLPDPTLLGLAQDGSILTETGFENALRHVFDQRRSKVASTVRKFYYEWLNLSKLPDLSTNTSLAYRNFTQGYSSNDLGALRGEAQAEVMNLGLYYTLEHPEGGNFADLFQSNRSFASGSVLPRVYGVASWNANSGTEGVAFPDGDPRGGILNRTAFLVNTGVANRLIVRGVHVRKDILCDQLNPPPADITPPEQMNLEPFPTTRQVMTETTKAAKCAACHNRINPLAFALEAYDSIGRFRNGHERVYDLSNPSVVSFRDKHVDLLGSPGITPSDRRIASTSGDYNSMLVASGKPQACMARSYFAFTNRREENLEMDGCEIDALREVATSGKLEDFFKAVAQRPAFKNRYIPK